MAANIFCCVCGARPYPPEGGGFREDFNLIKLVTTKDEKGRVTGRPADMGEGAWYCSRHYVAGPKGKYVIKLDADDSAGDFKPAA
jgi:hypothetical protein